MNDEYLRNVFTNKSPWSHNNNDIGGSTEIPTNNIATNITSTNNPAAHNTGNNNLSGSNNNGSGSGSGDNKPSVAEAIFHTMLHNPFGQKVLAAILLTIVVYSIYLAFLLPTMMDTTSSNSANSAALAYSTEYEDIKYRKKPSLMQKLFCRGGKTSSFCSVDERR